MRFYFEHYIFKLLFAPRKLSLLLTLEMRINQLESGVSNVYQRNGRPLTFISNIPSVTGQ